MNKLVASTLGALTLVLGASSAHAFDLGFDTSRLFIAIDDPAPIQMFPNTKHNPVLLACDVEMFGSHIRLDYTGSGPAVYPSIDVEVLDANDQPISSSGCTGTTWFNHEISNLSPMTAGTSADAGLTFVSSTSQFCAWMFQPGDLPADEVVRVHLTLNEYSNAAYTASIADSNAANDALDVWVKRECSCQ